MLPIGSEETGGYGYGLEGLNQENPDVAIEAMRRRIELVTAEDICKNCSLTDIFIAAGIAQNSDLLPSGMVELIPKPLRLNPVTPNGITIKWEDFFNSNDHHVRFQLKLFSKDARELQNRGWYIPGIDWPEIDRLTAGAYR